MPHSSPICQPPTLVVLLGSTGVGKTALSLELAERMGCPIVSADSRQIYREIPIGTAAPTAEERQRVEHHFVGCRSILEPYSAGQYELDALRLIEGILAQRGIALLSGGSMMYIDAVCRGIDDIPSVSAEIRTEVYQRFHAEGLEPILEELRQLDPIYYAEVDRQNHKRVLHGLEVCLSSGQPFSSFRTGVCKPRPFRIVKIGLQRPREELYTRINDRVLDMIRLGLVDEVRSVYPHREQNALNTVGYKELFPYIDGTTTLEEAIRRIQKNSRVYARKQQTWWQRDESIHWVRPELEAVAQVLSAYAINI